MIFAWHVHHDVLVEAVRGTLAERADYIQRAKPIAERELRLRLLKEVKGELPPSFVQAWARLDEVMATWGLKLWVYASPQYGTHAAPRHDGVEGDWVPAIAALHSVECPLCPWDGRSIFPSPSYA